MGTTYSVQFDGVALTPSDRATIRDTIQRRLDHVERLMSTYDSTSELSRFNRHESVTPFPVSSETLEVFRIARAVSETSGGAFDVTVGPLVNAWGFGTSDRPPTKPTESELMRLSPSVGYQLIDVDVEARTLTKRHPATVSDLSAIAKGFGVDQVCEALERMGFEAFLVEVGGELRARGTRSDGSIWSVGIERPDSDIRTAYRALALVDMAVATSGDYRNFFEIDGERYSHIIDPRTRAPVAHAGASVTVVHAEAVYADAWATALAVLGPEEGLGLAERESIAALFLVRSGDDFKARVTTEYRRTIEQSNK